MESSPLAKLPAELRVAIYNHLVTPSPVWIDLRDQHSIHRNKQHSALLALTRTCCQMQRECLELLYDNNVFRIPYGCLQQGSAPTSASLQDSAPNSTLSLEAWRQLVLDWLQANGIRRCQLDLGTWEPARCTAEQREDAFQTAQSIASIRRYFFQQSSWKIKIAVILSIRWSVGEYAFLRSVSLPLCDSKQGVEGNGSKAKADRASYESHRHMRDGTVVPIGLIKSEHVLQYMYLRAAVKEIVGWIKDEVA